MKENIGTSNDEVVLNKVYLDKKISELKGHLLFIEKKM